MADLTIAIKAVDAASAQLSKVRNEISGVGSASDTAGNQSAGFGEKIRSSLAPVAALGAAAAGGLYFMVNGIMSAVNAASKQQAAMMGLQSVARGFGQDMGAATSAAQALASDGLMTVGDAATGLKNLLAAGFSLPQAIQLMNRFKDSAAFARQGSLSFGEAIRGATEGIKNGNSILVDNAGVTKNLSMMLTEAGYSAQDLMKASSDAGVRQAIFNGIIKETNAQVGDAARLADSFAGRQAMLSARTEILKATIGEALQPVLAKLLDIITPIINGINNFAKAHPGLVAAIALGITAVLGFVVALGALAAAMLFVEVVGAPIIAIIAAIIAVVALVGVGINALVNHFGGWSAVMEKLKPTIQSLITFGQNLWKTLVEIATKIWSIVKPAFDLIAPALEVVRNAIVTWLIPALQYLWDKIQPLLPILKWVAIILGVVIVGAIAVVVIAFLLLVGIIVAVMTAIAYVVGWVVGAIVDAWNWCVKALGDVFLWIYNAAKDTWNWIKNAVKDVLDFIKSYISARVQDFVNAWNFIKSIPGIVAGAFGSVVNAVRNGIQNAYNTVAGFIGRFLDVGRDIITGIANGISGAAGKVFDVIKGIIGDVVGFAKRILGIGSPSKVFAEMGMWSMVGMAKGIASNAGAVSNALNSALSPIDTAINAGITANGAGTGSSGLAGAAGKVSPNVEIHVHVGVFAGMPTELREIALALWAETQRKAKSMGVTPNELVPV